MTNGNYNVHTEPRLKKLNMIEIEWLFVIQFIELWYEFTNDTLANFFPNMFSIF